MELPYKERQENKWLWSCLQFSGCGLIEKEGPNGELGGRCQEYASVKACLATCVASHDRDNYVSTSVSLVPA